MKGRPSVEEVVRESIDEEVGISYIIKRTGLKEKEVDQRLRSLHREGIIRYLAEEQLYGEKIAIWNFPHEDPE